MLKSRELLLKHNIEEFSVADEEKVYVSRVLSQKKESAKMRAIGKILETFFVSTVYHKGNGCIYLEVLGTQVNVEVAEYVSAFLERELDILWNEVKKQEDLKGLRSKNAFFLGLAKGYVEKTKTLVVYDEKALILIDAKLEKAKAIVYPRLSFSRSKNRGCSRSYHAGKEKGKALTIRPAVEAFVSKWLLVKK